MYLQIENGGYKSPEMSLFLYFGADLANAAHCLTLW